ncbi:MAG: hypothetical protein R3B84_05145 [Zavarzinella sp.]
MTFGILALITAAATWMMAGVIWFVQLVHYPLFRMIEPGRFPIFEEQHQQRTTWLVAPLMLAEAVGSISLLFVQQKMLTRSLLMAALLTLFLIWSATFFVQIPLHERLRKHWSEKDHWRLLRTNWVRTIGWTIRAGIMLAIVLIWVASQIR